MENFSNFSTFGLLYMLPTLSDYFLRVFSLNNAEFGVEKKKLGVFPEPRKGVSVYRDYKATGVSFFLFFHGELKS